jgi:type I restriction enzyme S subunit
MMESAAPKAFAIWFKELSRWDAKFFASRLFGLFPQIHLGDFVRERSERVNLSEHPEHTYTILGVNNTTGVFRAYDTKGKNINQPYKRVYTRDLFYNPYRVNVGSIGLVPVELGGNYTSPAYVVFSVDESKVIPELLELILRSDWYNPILRAATAGSVRQNLTFDLLTTLRIPLPPLSNQKTIMSRWRNTQAEIAQIRRQITDLENGIEASFLAELGLPSPKSTKLPKTFSLWWRELDRWSVLFNQLASFSIDPNESRYDVVSIGDIISHMQYGSSKKANMIAKGTPIIRMNNIDNGVLALDELKHVELTVSERKALLLNDGDILINRTNSKELVGKCAVFHESAEYVFASYLIRIVVDHLKVNSDYLAFVLNSNFGRRQIYSLSRQIGGQANINSDEIASISIPLPPLEIQIKLFTEVTAIREQVVSLKAMAKLKAEQAREEIKMMVLGKTEGG